MSDIQKIVDTLSSLTIIQAADLVKELEKQWGVSAAAPVAMAAAPAASSAAPAAEQSAFNVILKSAGGNKIAVIKAVQKSFPALGLKEAKDFVEAAPKAIKEGVSKDEATEIEKLFKEAGAEVEIK